MVYKSKDKGKRAWLIDNSTENGRGGLNTRYQHPWEEPAIISSFPMKARVSETLWATAIAADLGAGRNPAFHRPHVASVTPRSPWCLRRRRGVAEVGVRSSGGRISCVGEIGGDHLDRIPQGRA